jgi:hypothetical protein
VASAATVVTITMNRWARCARSSPEVEVRHLSLGRVEAQRNGAHVGLQVPEKGRAAFRRFLRDLGYDYADETRNPAYRFFLR